MEMFETKICPQCGQELFEDMTTCYGCLYSFEQALERQSVPALGLPDIDEPDLLDDDSSAASREPAKLMLKISTDDAQATVPIPPAGLVIGRDALADVVLKSRAVSKRHVRIVPLSNAAIVEDLGSTNPATYRGREIRETAVVHAGEAFEVCGSVFTVIV